MTHLDAEVILVLLLQSSSNSQHNALMTTYLGTGRNRCILRFTYVRAEEKGKNGRLRKRMNIIIISREKKYIMKQRRNNYFRERTKEALYCLTCVRL